MTDSIAIVGMACRYPDADSPEQLWENVLAQRQAFRRIPPERLRLEDYFDKNRNKPDTTYSSQAALLEGFEFDRQRYRVAGALYRTVDPSHWLALQVASEALTDAGYEDGERLKRETTGVVVGNTLTGDFSRATAMRLRWPFVRRIVENELANDEWTAERRHSFLNRLGDSYKAPFPPVGEETLAGMLSNTIAGRICNYYDLRGGGYTVDGACASSLIAVNTACSLLAAGDLDVAIAGGVDLSLDPFELVGFAKVGALATEKMRVYDERPEGFLPGEGCGFVVLMRHRDAVAKRRRIYAMIRGWGMSSDGQGGMTRPEVDGLSLAIERAYRRAGFSPKTVAYFEGHGTGTAVGDQTEMTALSRVISKRRNGLLANGARASLGSVKANIGHTKAAAGVAGLIKAVMAVHSQILPPASACENPHPLLKSESSVLRVLSEAELWPTNSYLRAGVSGLGFGGINAHLVLEGYGSLRRSELTSKEKTLFASAQDAEVFFLSAPDKNALRQTVRHLLTFAARISRAELTDLAATLEGQLQVSTIRAAIVASTPAQLADRLSQLDTLLENLFETGQTTHLDIETGIHLGTEALKPPRIGFLFPGQGAPLHLNGGLFKRRFAFLRDLFDGQTNGVEVADTGVAQPAILRTALAGMRTMKALGIEAGIAVGHSLGEIAALCWAGAISEDTLLRIGEARGAAMMEIPGPTGTMVSINATQQKVQTLLNRDDIVIASINGPQHTVLSGDAPSVASFVARAQGEGLTAIMVPVSHAFHSHLMVPCLTKVASFLKRESFGELLRPVVSTVTGNVLTGNEDLRQLLTRQITAPVLFMDAAERASRDVDLLIEIGAGRILGGLVKTFIDKPVVSLDAGGQSFTGLLNATGAAFALGVNINHHALFENRFTHEFNLDWQPRFLVNPCENAPVISDDQAEAHIVEEPSIDTTLKIEPTITTNGNGTQSPLEVFRRLVAERLELSPEDVNDQDRLLGDLHLNSLAVTQLITELSKRLGMSTPAAPTDYSTATIAAVAQAIEELRNTDVAPADTGLQLAGVDTWVRTFNVELVEVPLRRSTSKPKTGKWQVFGAADCSLKDALQQAFDANQIGPGVCLILPEYDETPRPDLLLAAVRAFQETPGARFVLVQRRGIGAAFIRTLALETSNAVVCVVNVPTNDERAVKWIVAEAASASSYSEAHYDITGTRRVPVLKLLPLPEKPSALQLSSDDLMVVSGGGKGIAAECAISVAKRTGVRLVLLGRSDPAKDDELARNLARMNALDIQFRYEQVDVTSQKQVSSTLRRIVDEFGPVTAFLHGAGANVPQLISALDEKAIRQTFAPKVDGARNILAEIDPLKLRLFISFGSVIGRSGMQGEADYALANETLRRITETWAAQHPHCKCLAVEWSIWSGVGMGERLGRVDALLRQGITPITPDEGVQVLNDLLVQDLPVTSVVAGGRFGSLPTLKTVEPELPFQRFLEKKLVYVPGVELIVDAELTIDSDPYLKDHVYQGQCLFPSVMGLEAMAQVSMALMETDQLPVFEGVQFNHPIVVSEDSSTRIRIAALKRSPGEIDVVVRCETTGFNVEHFSATCTFAKQDKTEARWLAKNAISKDKTCSNLLPAEHLYRNILFQSGRFERLESYRQLRARECVAEIRSQTGGDWFSSYLPADLLLGDPGARDASLHGIQACIPHQTILPVEVERITISAAQRNVPIVLLRARERARKGKRFIYDLEIAAESGEVLETWEGLSLHPVEAIQLSEHHWVESLLEAYIERRLDELLPSAGIRVAFDNGSEGRGRTRSNRAIRKCSGTRNVYRRPDGRPLVAGDLTVSASHDNDVTVAIAGRGHLGCDIEPVVEREPALWRDLLGPQAYDLAQLIAAQSGESESTAATRVWTILESIKKAGANVTATTMLDSIVGDRWVLLQSGDFRIASFVATLGDSGKQLALTFCNRAAVTPIGNLMRTQIAAMVR
ncbi:MAG TPA: SDR family NAD(P)-dependent oxidoreductase [Pyrinomonadaceae bacterium]|nr:SDR family NAD(P)-dependent oxidoreductase [Pyrinomonadaceae bacterium]